MEQLNIVNAAPVKLLNFYVVFHPINTSIAITMMPGYHVVMHKKNKTKQHILKEGGGILNLIWPYEKTSTYIKIKELVNQ